MREYYYAPLDYYFLTGRPSDFEVLDKATGWSRTGAEFITPTLSSSGATSVGVRRFYFDKIALNQQRGSHFYTLKTDEIAAVSALNPSNAPAAGKPVDEGDGFRAFALQADGTCPNSTLPIYRLFRGNTRFPDDPNHRFVSSVAAYNDFVAKGWTGEKVVFCVLATSSVALTPPSSGQTIANLVLSLSYVREEQGNGTSFYGLCSTILTVTNRNSSPIFFAAFYDWIEGGVVQPFGTAFSGDLLVGETKLFAEPGYLTESYKAKDPIPQCDRTYTLNIPRSTCIKNPRAPNEAYCPY